MDSFEQSKGKVLERCVQLNPDELPALAPRFPVFEAYAGRAAVASLLPQTEPEALGEDRGAEGELAEISLLSSEHHGKVLSRKRVLIGNAFALAGGLSFIGGLALLAWGASILEKADKDSADGKGMGVTLCVVGGALLLTALTGMLFDSSFGGNRSLRNAFKSELARRTGVLVEPNDPDALFVEVVPKLNWGKAMLDNASDIGLLLVDQARREVRFEGDKERWRVPAASITSCEVEKFVHGRGAVRPGSFTWCCARRDGKAFGKRPCAKGRVMACCRQSEGSWLVGSPQRSRKFVAWHQSEVVDISVPVGRESLVRLLAKAQCARDAPESSA
jgi:hypothetical protein